MEWTEALVKCPERSASKSSREPAREGWSSSRRSMLSARDPMFATLMKGWQELKFGVVQVGYLREKDWKGKGWFCQVRGRVWTRLVLKTVSYRVAGVYIEFLNQERRDIDA